MTQKTFAQGLFLSCFIIVVITLSNVFAYKHTVSETITGVLILVAIGFAGIMLSNFMRRFVKLPTMMYVSLIGLLLASPISPISDFLIRNNNNIAFLAPCLAMGSFVGISLGKDVKGFLKMGWKLILIAVVVITGTFIGSAIIADVVLRLMGK